MGCLYLRLIWMEENALGIGKTEEAKYIAKCIGCFELTIAHFFSQQAAEQEAIHSVQTDLNLVSYLFPSGCVNCLE